MRHILARVLAAVVIVAFWASQAIPASANEVLFQRGGCSGYGGSVASYVNQYSSYTDTFGTDFCNWYYLDCYWQTTNLYVYHGCPGWVQFPAYSSLSGTNAISSYHSLCSAGGTCPDSYPLIHTSAGTWYG